MKQGCMSPKSAERFWGNDMHEAGMHVAQKCGAVWDKGMQNEGQSDA